MSGKKQPHGGLVNITTPDQQLALRSSFVNRLELRLRILTRTNLLREGPHVA